MTWNRHQNTAGRMAPIVAQRALRLKSNCCKDHLTLAHAYGTRTRKHTSLLRCSPSTALSSQRESSHTHTNKHSHGWIDAKAVAGCLTTDGSTILNIFGIDPQFSGQFSKNIVHCVRERALIVLFKGKQNAWTDEGGQTRQRIVGFNRDGEDVKQRE